MGKMQKPGTWILVRESDSLACGDDGAPGECWESALDRVVRTRRYIFTGTVCRFCFSSWHRQLQKTRHLDNIKKHRSDRQTPNSPTYKPQPHTQWSSQYSSSPSSPGPSWASAGDPRLHSSRRPGQPTPKPPRLSTGNVSRHNHHQRHKLIRPGGGETYTGPTRCPSGSYCKNIENK